MKKLLAIVLALIMVFAFAACGEEKKPEVDYTKKSDGVMTYAEYDAAALDAEVTVEVFVQNHQSWWDNKITVYAADPDGGYFLYELACKEEDAAKFVPGTKIKVHGYKSEWSGEVEITDGTFEFCEEGSGYIAEAKDVTELLGKEEMIKNQNQFITLKGLTVEKEALYKWDGSGSQGDDLYFDVSKDGTTYTFTVESYLCGKDTDVYKAVEALKVGDKIDVEGFCYWYNGMQPHVTAVSASK